MGIKEDCIPLSESKNEASYTTIGLEVVAAATKMDNYTKLPTSVLQGSCILTDEDGDNELENGVVQKDGYTNSSRDICLGGFLAFLSGCFYCFMYFILKIIPYIDVMEVLVFRAVVLCIIPCLFVIYRKESLLGPAHLRCSLFWMLIMAGLKNAVDFLSFRFLPLGDAMAIVNAYPIVVMLLAVPLFKEPCGLYRTLVAILLLLGIIFLSKPSFIFHNSPTSPGSYHWLGYLLALSSSCFKAVLRILEGKTKSVHTATKAFYQGFGTLIIANLLLFTIGKPAWPEAVSDWVLCFLTGFLGLTNLLLLLKATELDTPTRVSMIRSLDMVLAYVLQVTVLHTPTHWTNILGSLLLVASVFFVQLEQLL